MSQNFNVCDDVTPANAMDGVETALMKALEETYVTAVVDPSTCSVEESCKSHGPVDLNLFLVLQESVVNFFVGYCIR